MKIVFQRLSLAAFACLLILTASSVAIAQDLDDVTVSGRVTDANGAAVPGVTVTAIQVETTQERTATLILVGDQALFRLE